jgi:mono/diheme cytochrome c family protein
MRTPPALVIAFLAPAFAAFAAAEPDVQRIFAEHCLECHGPDDKKGGLALTARENLFKELESGAVAVVPGDPAKSELVARILSKDPDEQMPPKKKKPLAAAEIEALKAWVAGGAEWKVHWAYAPVARPRVPAGVHPVDHFIRTKLAAKKIQPAPEADRYTLIRRVYYDLLGLPPTPSEADAFVNDTAPGTYERLVDRALASPHFGERWGRHWLDRARYADSDGYEKDRPRPDAWRYRDWVIDAVNRDLPFDQFTIEQLAGDLLPNATPEQKLATAFHRQTLTNTEGGVDQEQFRVEATFDRTETTGSVWLAHTVGCARCHTHKYDAITQREYYQLFAFFNNADETKTTVATSATAEQDYERKNAAHAAKLRKLTAKVAVERERLTARLYDWEKEIAPRLAAAEGAKARPEPIEIDSVSSEADVEFQRLDDGSWLATTEGAPTDTYKIVADLPPGVISGLRLEVLPDESLPKNGPGRAKDGNFVLSKFSVEAKGETVGVHSPEADFSQATFPVATALEGRADKGWGIAPKAGAAHHADFQLVRPLEGGQRITISLAHLYAKGKYTIGRFRLVALVGETPESIAPKTVRNFIAIGSEKWTNDTKDALVEWLEQVDPAASRVAAELAAAKAAAPPPPVLDVRIFTERKQPRETKVLHRGEFLQPGEPVGPGTLAVLPPIAARGGQSPDRLDLARWLVNETNPLTPRVIVNQFWMQLFGEGLVRTAGDFGVRGEKPSHPELLDWLASEFMVRHWSRKQLLRLIMTSATYRQRSEVRPELAETDPLNLLLARQNRLRVEGEIVRDLHLAASGLLAPKIGGPSVFPPMPPEIAALSYANNFKWTDAQGEDRYRRGMYTFFKRTAPHPDLTTFDCPDANLTAVKRTVSNTPLQALTTLNAQSFAEAAAALAKRVLAEPLADDRARLTRAFRLALVRPPLDRELTALRDLLTKARRHYAQSPDHEAEPAAWTATVRIVLNTDEFITRE